MKSIITLTIFLLSLALVAPAQAIDFNLINVNMGSPQSQQLAGTYGKAYGYTPQEVAPAMAGPAEEVPSIMQIAKSAGTVPMTVWMMRRMGMSYTNILSTFALAPATLAGGPMGRSPYSSGPAYGASPSWSRVTDPFYVQLSRINFLTKVLRVNPSAVPYIPAWGAPFSQSLLHPYHPVYGTWLPPGIAKKYGLWVPPGQAKKMGWFPGSPGWKYKGHGKNKHAWKKGKGGHEDFDHQGGHKHKKGKWENHQGDQGGKKHGGSKFGKKSDFHGKPKNLTSKGKGGSGNFRGGKGKK